MKSGSENTIPCVFNLPVVGDMMVFSLLQVSCRGTYVRKMLVNWQMRYYIS